jgi:hypothetical protein
MKNKQLINILSKLQDDSEIIIKYKGKELVIDKISKPVVFKEIYIDLIKIKEFKIDDVISNAKIDKENFYQWIEIDKDLIEKISNKDDVLSWNGKKIKEM